MLVYGYTIYSVGANCVRPPQTAIRFIKRKCEHGKDAVFALFYVVSIAHPSACHPERRRGTQSVANRSRSFAKSRNAKRYERSKTCHTGQGSTKDYCYLFCVHLLLSAQRNVTQRKKASKTRFEIPRRLTPRAFAPFGFACHCAKVRLRSG